MIAAYPRVSQVATPQPALRLPRRALRAAQPPSTKPCTGQLASWPFLHYAVPPGAPPGWCKVGHTCSLIGRMPAAQAAQYRGYCGQPASAFCFTNSASARMSSSASRGPNVHLPLGAQSCPNL